MLARIATGLVLAPLVVALLLWGPLLAIAAVLAVVAGLAAHELLAMEPACRPADRALALTLATLAAFSPWLGAPHPQLTAMLSVVVVLSWSLLRPGDLAEASRRAVWLILGVAYVGGLCGALTAIAVQQSPQPQALASFPFGPAAVLTLLMIVFFGDTGAYFAGKSLGRHRLYPLISPKKTVEGAIGGLLASTGGGVLGHYLLVPQLSLVECAALGGLCGAVAQVGDLAESLFKRATQTKDSGRLLPGHGGMLDRIDGVLFAAPVFLSWLHLAHHLG